MGSFNCNVSKLDPYSIALYIDLANCNAHGVNRTHTHTDVKMVAFYSMVLLTVLFVSVGGMVLVVVYRWRECRGQCYTHHHHHHHYTHGLAATQFNLTIFVHIRFQHKLIIFVLSLNYQYSPSCSRELIVYIRLT